MQVKFFSVGCGDFISIRFLGNDLIYHNIFIDGGTEKGDIYEKTLQIEIRNLLLRKENIDLWIISHIDDDHIGGILRLIKDTALLSQIDLSNTKFWYNYSNYDYDTGLKVDTHISVNQGILLRDFLKKKSKLSESVTDESGEINFFGMKITILSPNKKKLDSLKKLWLEKEVEIKKRPSSSPKSGGINDYKVKISDFELNKFRSDNSKKNGSSIAILLEHEGKKVLLLSDSHPNVIANSLKKLKWSDKNKIDLNYMQIAHHGSKKNTNDKLLKMINCSNFIISADAFNKNNLPNKETMARLMRNFSTGEIKFHITNRNALTESIFDVDDDLTVETIFPRPGSNALIFDL